MSRDPRNVPQEDLPWNDVAADSDVVPGTEEPDPAEVEGDEDDDAQFDAARGPIRDIDHRDTLDERLAEEEPDRVLGEQDPEAGEIMAAESDQDDVVLSEAEPDSDGDDEEPAEESAVHIRPRP